MTAMPDLTSCLHICTDDSSAGAVKQVLRQEGLPGRLNVASSLMMENVGPLQLLARPKDRLEWFSSVGFDLPVFRGQEPEDLIDDWQSFWTQFDEWTGPVMVWFSSLSAMDRSLLLALCDQIPDHERLFILDVGRPAGDNRPVTAIGELNPLILQQRLPHCRQVDADLAAAFTARYAEHSSNPQALRLLTEGSLVEAPIQTADARFLAKLSKDWCSLARAAAETAGSFGNGGFRDLDYTWLLWRLEELQRAGTIERRGGSFDPSFLEHPFVGEVRLRC